MHTPAPCHLVTLQEWLKPIMFSGGLGQIDNRHLHKADGEVRVAPECCIARRGAVGAFWDDDP